jgi:hypothetical protein
MGEIVSFFYGADEFGSDGGGDGFFNRKVYWKFTIVAVADLYVLHLRFKKINYILFHSMLMSIFLKEAFHFNKYKFEV